ncbi:MAG: triose-phosphate isomerase, partial [Alphaproteobacteria bacterium]|nr:triose-phosphate isomerase [Alphaproteobacteria bacterium]
VAYEPVWAIGTGKTASVDDVAEMHGFIREQLKELVPDADKVRILYGGSMKPENAGALLSTENVDGGLIGGASLSAEQFLAIARAAV